MKENGREQGLTDKDVARKFAKGKATAQVSLRNCHWKLQPIGFKLM